MLGPRSSATARERALTEQIAAPSHDPERKRPFDGLRVARVLTEQIAAPSHDPERKPPFDGLRVARVLTEQIAAPSHDPERKRRQRAGVGPRED
jgi:hypothetical protein